MRPSRNLIDEVPILFNQPLSALIKMEPGRGQVINIIVNKHW